MANLGVAHLTAGQARRRGQTCAGTRAGNSATSHRSAVCVPVPPRCRRFPRASRKPSRITSMTGRGGIGISNCVRGSDMPEPRTDKSIPNRVESDSLPKQGKHQESSSFLKKRTKKLLPVSPSRFARSRSNRAKVFCFFFSKKKYLLAALLFGLRHVDDVVVRTVRQGGIDHCLNMPAACADVPGPYGGRRRHRPVLRSTWRSGMPGDFGEIRKVGVERPCPFPFTRRPASETVATSGTWCVPHCRPSPHPARAARRSGTAAILNGQRRETILAHAGAVFHERTAGIAATRRPGARQIRHAVTDVGRRIEQRRTCRRRTRACGRWPASPASCRFHRKSRPNLACSRSPRSRPHRPGPAARPRRTASVRAPWASKCHAPLLA